MVGTGLSPGANEFMRATHDQFRHVSAVGVATKNGQEVTWKFATEDRKLAFVSVAFCSII